MNPTVIKTNSGNYAVSGSNWKSVPEGTELKDIEWVDTIPKIKKLDRAIVKCEVTRSEFNDGNYVYDVGLRFIPANTDYLKELIELLKTS